MQPTFDFKAELTEVLTTLGLTATQARAYAALCQLGISTVKTIAKESKIARQDIYRVLAELEAIGFVEKAIASPVMFEPIPPEEAIDIMMKARVKENHELQVKTEILVKRFSAHDKNSEPVAEEPQFVLIPKGKASLRKMREAMNSTQSCIDCITSYKQFFQSTFASSEHIVNTLNKGVKFRFILEKTDTEKSLPKILEEFCKTSSCNIRYSFYPLPSTLTLYDNREVLILTSTNGDREFTKTPMLWSKNPALIFIIKDYYEAMWNQALAGTPTYS